MIPVSEPIIGNREVAYVMECLRTGWISSAGRFIDEFEEKWSAYCGMAYGIAVSNGTVALQTAVACLGFEPGFQVIMPSFTIISCALAVLYNGGIPVFVDCAPDTWCMNVNLVAEKIKKDRQQGGCRIKAVMPVHIYGHPVDMDPIKELAGEYNLKIIEDAAEVHGAEYLTGRGTPRQRWEKCGGFGHVSTFSFYANKLITTGEGGMVLTNDEKLAEKARSLRNLSFRPEQRFIHTELGHNFRLTNLQAAIGLAQLERIDDIVARKRRMGQLYMEQLKDIPLLQLPVEQPWARQVYWMYGIVLNEAAGMDARTFARILKGKGVETRPFFLGMHEQPVLRTMGLSTNERYPVAERIARQGLYLPSGLAITEAQIGQVAYAVKEALEGK
jgi:perosamine synthetase